jgi:hypothetical protein
LWLGLSPYGVPCPYRMGPSRWNWTAPSTPPTFSSWDNDTQNLDPSAPSCQGDLSNQPPRRPAMDACPRRNDEPKREGTNSPLLASHSPDQTASNLPPSRRIAVQAGAQILTHRQPPRVSRSGGWGVGDGSPPRRRGVQGRRPGFSPGGVQGRAGPVNRPAPQVQIKTRRTARRKKKNPKRQRP